jgi:pyroglutamyl-peptidase
MEFDVNASYLIANSLPSIISPSNNSASKLRRINITVHRPAVETSYHDVREQVPKFFAEYNNIDFVLHMGIASPRQYYTISKGSYRDNYNYFPDADGKYARDLEDLPGGEHLWRDDYHAPRFLKSSIPMDDLWRRSQSLLLGKQYSADLRLEDDAGHYLCGFIYYAGLVERWRKHEDQNVLFVHTKGETDDDTVAEGREVALAVIRAAVETIEREKKKSWDSCLALCGKCAIM